MEEKLDELIALTKLQNNAWEHCLNMLNGIATIMNEKHNAQEKILQEHPPIREPTSLQRSTTPPTESPTVGSQRQPQPFNNYTDTVRYGAGLEEERVPAGQSFPPPNPNEFQSAAQQFQQTDVPPQDGRGPSTPQPQPPQAPPEPVGNAGETVVTLDQNPEPEAPIQGPPVQSKAELLERQGGTS